VAQDHVDEALRRDWVARYDVALQARDEAGIAAYMVAVEYLTSSRTRSAEAWLGGSMIMSPNNAGSFE
jgi:hypothetical protein